MPVYEYECCSCSVRFDVRMGFNENNAVSCPQCRSQARRVFSPVPIIFKGSGFYVTDHRTEDQRKPAKSHDTESPSKSAEPAGEKI